MTPNIIPFPSGMDTKDFVVCGNEPSSAFPDLRGVAEGSCEARNASESPLSELPPCHSVACCLSKAEALYETEKYPERSGNSRHNPPCAIQPTSTHCLLTMMSNRRNIVLGYVANVSRAERPHNPKPHSLDTVVFCSSTCRKRCAALRCPSQYPLKKRHKQRSGD